MSRPPDWETRGHAYLYQAKLEGIQRLEGGSYRQAGERLKEREGLDGQAIKAAAEVCNRALGGEQFQLGPAKKVIRLAQPDGDASGFGIAGALFAGGMREYFITAPHEDSIYEEAVLVIYPDDRQPAAVMETRDDPNPLAEPADSRWLNSLELEALVKQVEASEASFTYLESINDGKPRPVTD